MVEESSKVSPAVIKAHLGDNASDGIVTLKTGDRVKILPVTAAVITDVTSMIKDPPVPTWHDKDKDEDIPNPDHPDYISAMEAANRERGSAVIDAMVMFGIELVDGVPPVEKWLYKLTFLQKRGRIDLSGYNLEDPIDIEFIYKRYLLVDNKVMSMIGEASGISEEEVNLAEKSFPGK